MIVTTAALLVAGAAAAGDRLVPVGYSCAAIQGHYLGHVRDTGDGWLRAYVVSPGGLLGEDAPIPADAPHHVWDVDCAGGRVVEVGVANDRAGADILAGTAPVGQGHAQTIRCSRTEALPGAVRMICDYHANAVGDGNE